MIKKELFILLCIPIIGFGQTFSIKTYVPDDNFENYLEANGMGDGIQLNDSINFWAIEMLINLDVSNQNISDLTGIEDFTVISSLDCSNNNLTNLDLTQNNYLQILDCSYNQLTSLSIIFNALQPFQDYSSLMCNNNQLESLDLTQSNCSTFVSNESSFKSNPNLNCIQVSNPSYWENNLIDFVDTTYQYYNIDCIQTTDVKNFTSYKELLKVTDLLGRKIKGTKNKVLCYIYDDGTVEKRIIIE